MALHVRGVILPDDEVRDLWLVGDRVTLTPVPSATTISSSTAVTASAPFAIVVLVVSRIGALFRCFIPRRAVSLLKIDPGANDHHHGEHEQYDELRAHAKSFLAG